MNDAETPTLILETSAKKAREVLSTLGVLTETEFNMTINMVMQTKQFEFQAGREKEALKQHLGAQLR